MTKEQFNSVWLMIKNRVRNGLPEMERMILMTPVETHIDGGIITITGKTTTVIPDVLEKSYTDIVKQYFTKPLVNYIRQQYHEMYWKHLNVDVSLDEDTVTVQILNKNDKEQ